LYVVERDWKLLTILKSQKEERLPEIPSYETIRKIFSCVTPHSFFPLLDEDIPEGLQRPFP